MPQRPALPQPSAAPSSYSSAAPSSYVQPSAGGAESLPPEEAALPEESFEPATAAPLKATSPTTTQKEEDVFKLEEELPKSGLKSKSKGAAEVFDYEGTIKKMGGG